MKEFLNINNLSVSVDEKNIIDNLNLKINQGEIHAIMGPNGSGKSTLSNVLAGKDGYSITNGNILFCEENLLEFFEALADDDDVQNIFSNLEIKNN